jgi:hypothetical protein
MARRVLPLTCTITANTAISTPQHFPLQFAPAAVERIDVRIPPGPSGLVGFAINNGGGNFIPEGAGTWVIANDQFIQWPLDDAPDNGTWDIAGYNLDVIDHTLYFFFNIATLVVVSAPTIPGPIGL